MKAIARSLDRAAGVGARMFKDSVGISESNIR
jgi:hypothetical protein